MSKVIVGTRIPDSALVRDIDEPVRGVATSFTTTPEVCFCSPPSLACGVS
jgi:hypothetical protein